MKTIYDSDLGNTIEGDFDVANYIYGFGGSDILLGRNFNDYLVGGEGNDLVRGRESNDFVFGREGNDFVGGGKGDDFVDGDEGNDKLYGRSGNDTLAYSGWGFEQNKDILVGGDGADTFRLEANQFNAEYGGGSNSYALIEDFTPSEGDLIQLYEPLSSYGIGTFQGKEALFFQGDLLAVVEGFQGLTLSESYIKTFDGQY